MYFYDTIFAIEPLAGKIWAKSRMTVTVSFSPKAALHYHCLGYCSIVGQAERIPMKLTGHGIGPKAAFSYDEMDVGDIFVESMHRYEVDILNQGDIAVNYELVPNTGPFGSKFQFTPAAGRLDVDCSETIEIEFCPNILGEFNESFHWELSSNNKSACTIPITFKGNSVCPTFHFDVDRVNYGIVSYGFLNCKTITLSNDSEVTMRYGLRIPGDGRFLQKEYDIIPSKGVLLPNCSQKVQIDFISTQAANKQYDLALVVDLDGVGQELGSLPITARCAVPTVAFEPYEAINFGEVFIRYAFYQCLVIHNTSALPAKFQILPQDETSR
jgi:hydrocephalus-inducing protein